MSIDKMVLKMRQAMPLKDKIEFSKKRIHDWIEYFGIGYIYISFSGGKDSTVLLDLVRQEYPEAKGMYVDTGLEYLEIKQFVKTKNNIDIIRPKKMFYDVINEYGYPIISKEVSECVSQARIALERNNGQYAYRLDKINGTHKNKDGTPSQFNYSQWKFLLDAPFKISHKCCNVMKKGPAHKYHKDTKRNPIIGTMAEESRLREQKYLKTGCNAWENKIPTSTPLAFWTSQDILQYLYENKIPYCNVYGEIKIDKNGKYYTTGCQRTGCMFCGFGCHLEKEPNRFQKLKETHPKQYDYIINQLGMSKVLDYINCPY